jgi:hypothetical protein
MGLDVGAEGGSENLPYGFWKGVDEAEADETW